MTKDELVAQTREVFDLWNAHDAPGLARFYASGATVRDANGNVVGSGTVAITGAATVEAAIGGTAAYTVNGSGGLSFYGEAGASLGISRDWSAYSATASSLRSLSHAAFVSKTR